MKSDTQRAYIYGIDFGTSNSAVAVWDVAERSIFEHPELAGSQPSLLYFPWARSISSQVDRVYLSREAVERYVADNMDGRLLQAIKTVLPDRSFTNTMINGITYSIEDFVAIIIRNLKERADAVTGCDVRRAVVGRPAVFSEDPEREQLAVERLEKAARLAGFDEIRFVFEPVAAAFAYEAALCQSETVLVGDVGGGTSDFTVVRLDPDKRGRSERQSDILATFGVSVAGNRLDSDIMWHRLTPRFGRGASYQEYSGGPILKALTFPHHEICRWDRIPFLAKDIKLMETMRKMSVRSTNRMGFSMLQTLIKKNMGFALFQEIEKTKIALTERDDARLIFHGDEISLDELITLTHFKHYTDSARSEIGSALDEVLIRDGCRDRDIDAVFLTGGSSLVRDICGLFTKRFGEERIRTGDTFSSVARGLAFSAPFEYAE